MMWRTHSCVPRSHSCERFLCWHDCQHGTHECAMSLSFLMSEHFKELMFDCHKQLAMPKGTPISKASVHMSVNAARMSACATMISIFYQASSKTK
jgi:hypothetical protein